MATQLVQPVELAKQEATEPNKATRTRESPNTRVIETSDDNDPVYHKLRPATITPA